MLRRPFAAVALGGIAAAVLLVAVSFGAFMSSATDGTNTARLIRWGNVALRVPEDPTVTVSRTSLPKEENPPDGGLVLYLEKPPSRLIVSAETGSVLYDSVMEEDRATFDEITATIVVGAPHQGALGWPYAADAPPGPRERSGNLSLNMPAPSSGIELVAMQGYGGPPYIRVSNGRSLLFINANTGAVLQGDTVILSRDEEAFERLLATVEVGDE